MRAASRAFPRFSCARLFLLDHVQEHIRNTQVLYSAASNVALFDLPKAIAVCVRLVYLAERDVHKVIAVDEMSVERLPIFELDQHRLVLCGVEKG
jgi:hypothetical protein